MQSLRVHSVQNSKGACNWENYLSSLKLFLKMRMSQCLLWTMNVQVIRVSYLVAGEIRIKKQQLLKVVFLFLFF